MKATTDKLRNVLVRRYHTLCCRLGLNADDKHELLAAYEAQSSLELSTRQLEDLCSKLDAMLHPELGQLDKWRKRLMAAIGGWLRLLGQEDNAQRIRAIACRAAMQTNYNDIPVDRLRNLYYSFVNKQKDFRQVQRITSEELEILSFMN